MSSSSSSSSSSSLSLHRSSRERDATKKTTPRNPEKEKTPKKASKKTAVPKKAPKKTTVAKKKQKGRTGVLKPVPLARDEKPSPFPTIPGVSERDVSTSHVLLARSIEAHLRRADQAQNEGLRTVADAMEDIYETSEDGLFYEGNPRQLYFCEEDYSLFLPLPGPVEVRCFKDDVFEYGMSVFKSTVLDRELEDRLSELKEELARLKERKLEVGKTIVGFMKLAKTKCEENAFAVEQGLSEPLPRGFEPPDLASVRNAVNELYPVAHRGPHQCPHRRNYPRRV